MIPRLFFVVASENSLTSSLSQAKETPFSENSASQNECSFGEGHMKGSFFSCFAFVSDSLGVYTLPLLIPLVLRGKTQTETGREGIQALSSWKDGDTEVLCIWLPTLFSLVPKFIIHVIIHVSSRCCTLILGKSPFMTPFTMIFVNQLALIFLTTFSIN
jgi:hypothetical protein